MNKPNEVTETGMRKECEEHLISILANSNVELSRKYVAGQREHGGDLWRKGLETLIGPEIRAEALDLVVYTECLSVGLLRIRQICEDGLETGGKDSGAGLMAIEILKVLDGEITDTDKIKYKA